MWKAVLCIIETRGFDINDCQIVLHVPDNHRISETAADVKLKKEPKPKAIRSANV